MSKHTPGPWESVEGDVEAPSGRYEDRGGSRRKVLADVVASVHPIERGDRQANSRLIAAAPEMLKALEIVVGDWEYNPENVRFMKTKDIEFVRNVLLKAKGES